MEQHIVNPGPFSNSHHKLVWTLNRILAIQKIPCLAKAGLEQHVIIGKGSTELLESLTSENSGHLKFKMR